MILVILKITLIANVCYLTRASYGSKRVPYINVTCSTEQSYEVGPVMTVARSAFTNKETKTKK